MVPPLPPSSSDPAAGTPAGGEDMDFDALDFSFLDGEEAALSTEDTPAKAEPAPVAAPEAPAAGDDFDLAAWDAAEPTAEPEPEAASAAAPVAAADPVEDLGLDADFSFGAEAETTVAETVTEDAADEDPFADLRSPEPEAPSLTKAAENPLAVSFGEADFEAEEDDIATPTDTVAEAETALFDEADDTDFALEDDGAPLIEADPEDSDSTEPAAPSGPRKYLFDRSFDYVPPPPSAPEPEPEPEIEVEPVLEAEPEFEPEPEPEPEEPPPPPPPTFSEEELAAARASSYADGETAGLQTAMATVEARGSRALEAIAQQVPGLLADRQQVVTNVAHEAARLAYALVARMMPELARTYGLGEIEAVVRDSLGMAVDQPRITVRVQPEIAELLHPKLEGMALNAGFNGHINLLADASLGPSDVRVEWGDGGAERLIQRAWNDVTEIVRRSVADLKERTGAGIADESAVVQGYETASL